MVKRFSSEHRGAAPHVQKATLLNLTMKAATNVTTNQYVHAACAHERANLTNWQLPEVRLGMGRAGEICQAASEDRGAAPHRRPEPPDNCL